MQAPRKNEVAHQVAAIEDALRRRGVRSLSIFGSVVRDAARADSDIDVLIDVEPGVKFSLIDLAEIKDLLEDHLNRKVDVVTQAGLAPDVRERVLQETASVF